jgi:hypothetical protein
VRKIVSWILLGLGAFLLVTAIVATVWAPDQVKRAPIDTNSTTRLSGTAAAVPTGDTDVDVRAVSVTKSDSKKSDDDVAVYTNYTCLVLDNPGPDCGIEGEGDNADPNVISVGTPTVFATDRYTGMATMEGDYLPDGTPETEGLVNKFGFDTEKKDYPFWDGVLQRAVTATFEGTDTIDGLDVYEFNYTVVDEPAEIASGVEGNYSMDKTMWIEPKTGQIIDQEQHDVRSANGTTLLDVELSFTDDQVATNVDDAKANVSSLDLITGTVPLIGFILGPILLIAGAIGLVLSRRSEGTSATRDHVAPRTPAHNG